MMLVFVETFVGSIFPISDSRTYFTIEDVIQEYKDLENTKMLDLPEDLQSLVFDFIKDSDLIE